MRGFTTAANATPDPIPKTPTAIASSKLLFTAVNDMVVVFE